MKRDLITLFIFFATILIIPSDLTAAVMGDYCVTPPFIAYIVPPNVMLMLSIETPMQGAAHPDVICTGDPRTSYSCSFALCRSTPSGKHISNCYDNSKTYYGYFDPNKCYRYVGGGNAGRFEPIGNANNHQCSGYWSGNFLNWATTMAVDAFRKAMTGGNRKIDAPGNTQLLGARQTLPPGHAWFPIKRIGNGQLYTPYSGTVYLIRYANGFVVCRDTNNDGMPDCGVGTTGSGENMFPTVSNKRCSNDVFKACNSNSDCSGGACQAVNGGVAAFNLQVEVCNPSKGLEANCNPQNNKSEGVIQKYADKMRFGLISYAMKNNPDPKRDGGVIRANMKWISHKIPYGLKYHDATGNLVTCNNPDGCPNPEAEINADGTFKTNPDNIGGASYSGVINYINKFGYISGYKSYDPISEMYYEIVRYFKKLGPSTNKYCTELDSKDDGAPVYCNTSSRLSWRDPYIYTCQKSFVVAINDANPWRDKRIPGTRFMSAYDDNQQDWGVPSNADNTINVSYWTDQVGNIEGITPGNMCIGCVLGGPCDWQATQKNVSALSYVAGTCPYPPKRNSYYIAGLAYYAHETDLRSDLDGKQNLITYMIDTQEATSNMLVGRYNMLYLAGKFGGFEDINGNGRPDLQSEWDKDNDGFPDNYFFASDPAKIEEGLEKAFSDILKRTASGTAVSILASGEGQGAILPQAVFYPKKSVGNTEISWIGAMQNLWYYIDPLFQLSTIREDTVQDKKLNLTEDYITNIYFDQAEGKTKASRCLDSDGDGDCDTVKPTVNFEDLKNLWEAGIRLFQKAPAQRTIYTNYNGRVSFNATLAGDATFRGLLQASNYDEATKIINYIRGADITNYRKRAVTLNIGGTNVTNTWKLGDIVHSTPRIQSWVPLNDYHEQYNDNTYLNFINDRNDDGTEKLTKLYTNRGMVYVGANDGMLHAFYLGKLKLYGGTGSLKAELQDVSSTYDPGDEVWSFIPKNALPYLKYLMYPDYCHLYYVDASPYIFDASINKYTGCTKANYWDCEKKTDSWRTILIGSMNLGGACRNTGSTCTVCVKTPVANTGYSSYFALDITDQNDPKLLWEFSNEQLGFSTSGPVVFRAGSSDKNGRWFVMFASGPTGPIDTSAHNFMGRSDQNLKLFILDLASGSLLSTIDTGIQNAFAGSILNSVTDLDDDYQDDVIYIPYSTWENTSNSLKGGIGRFITKDLIASNPDFTGRWRNVINTSGPVTSAPVFLRSKSRHELWLYFGTGRYFYKTDDLTGRRRIYGIKEPCYSTTTDNIDPKCSTSLSEASLSDSTSSIASSINAGWYINLDCAATDTCTYKAPPGYGAERVITTPLASPIGAVFFTTFSPTSDICGYGGSSYVWAVNYRTGGVAPSAALQGKALLQLSTGEIKEIDLKTAFTDRIPSGGSGGRRSVGFFGVPPQGQGLSAIVPADPIKRFIFIKEK